MVRIKGFKAIRPKRELASKIASPPYDVVSSEEARILVNIEPYSFLHVVKSEVDLPPQTNLYDHKVYAKASENLKMFREKYMIQDVCESMYIYRQILNGRSQTGLIAVQHIDDYLDGHVKIHELTREEKEIDRINHIDIVNAHTGPVFFTYQDNRKIDRLIEDQTHNKAEYDFTTQDTVRHTLWLINNNQVISELRKHFANIEYVYVADGHHRSKASATVGKMRRDNNPQHTGKEEYNWFLAVFFPDNQLNIIDYNRIIKDLNGLNEDKFLSALQENFDLEKTCCKDSAKPRKEHDFAMYLGQNWYKLRLKTDKFDLSDPVESLDSALLTNLILSPILGIQNIRKDNRIDFVGGDRGLEELEKRVNSGEMKLAFALYPITIEQLIEVADSKALMPPKTTWFEPKLRSGLFVHSLED
ncbi:MAG: DUF1015 family protein [Candidatus Neomarinimicrobiota bacterium]